MKDLVGERATTREALVRENENEPRASLVREGKDEVQCVAQTCQRACKVRDRVLKKERKEKQ